MVGKMESLKINGMIIKKGSNVEIDIWGDKKTMIVTVLDITLNGYEADIESITSNGIILHHSDAQWEDMLVRVL